MSSLLEVSDLKKFYKVDRSLGREKIGSDNRRSRASFLHAVDGVSFSVSESEAVGLVGESGCGKSTLSRLLAKLLDATSGSVRFCGDEIGPIAADSFTENPYRSNIQMVFQDPIDSLNPRFSAFDVIADPLRRLKHTKGQMLDSHVEAAARAVGLPGELLSRFPHQLSGGQLARIGIARAISVNPKLLILDEPTSSLDVSIQAIILKLLDGLRRQTKIAYFFVSHDLNVVRLICDRVLVMYLGIVVEAGPADIIFRIPHHPYTKALISAIPQIDPELREIKLRVDGEPLSPIDVPQDRCRFAERCPFVASKCRLERPPMREVEPAHWVACHFPLGIGRD